jgi:hypothetical protein
VQRAHKIYFDQDIINWSWAQPVIKPHLLELGIEGRDMEIAFAEINVFCCDLGHFTYTQAISGQKGKFIESVKAYDEALRLRS